MKKILIASLLVAMGGSAFAASDTAGTKLEEGPTTVQKSKCELLSDDVKVTLSKGNIGHVACDDGKANIGVAVGNKTGKGVYYSVGSSGGAIVPSTDGKVPDADLLKTAADKAASS
jgi:hypothetical protein